MINSNVPKIEINATHILFISDIHFGRHVNSEEWQDNMKKYFQNFFIPYIRKIKSCLKPEEKLICINLGDTYQDRKAIDINVYNLAIDMCEDIAKEVELYVINGNHDLAKKTNEGNTSLRSLEYMPNITLIQEPTLLSIQALNKKIDIIAIPYLGDCEKETEYLAGYSGKTSYALMHTDLTALRYDNGMLITNGANPDIYKGRIFSGHIHKRQEVKNAIYVGSPYHLDKSDIGNTKGLYILELESGKISFDENTYSPVYHTIDMEKLVALNETDRSKFFDNNYNFIIIQEDDVPKYKKKYDLYNLGAGTKSKLAKPVIIKKKQTIAAEIDNDYKEKTIEELINESINQLEIDEDAKLRIIDLSNTYFKDAEEKLSFN